MDNQEKPKIQ